MTTSFLYQRMVKDVPGSFGTLSEPGGTPKPRFALQATVNWMRALAILVQDKDIASMENFYREKNVTKAKLCERAVNTVFEQLLMSLHHLAALRAMASSGHSLDLSRVAIVTWYYGIYCAASAMVTAKDGSWQDNHTGTADQWDRQIAACKLIPQPFDFRLTTMLRKVAESEIDVIRNGSSFNVNSRPTNSNEAVGACASYLSGTREHREKQIGKELLKKHKLSDFQKTNAKKIRDDILAKKTVGFMHQSFRYRGKANYRDALFLTYQAKTESKLHEFLTDMEHVLKFFVSAAGAYCCRRVDNANWTSFLEDLERNFSLAVKPKEVWS